MKYPLKFTAGLLLACSTWGCQEKTVPQTSAKVPQEVTIAFYNLENLFDTENDPNKDDEEFLPTSESQWTPERYAKKLTNMASVIEKLGDEDGPELLGVCEIENRKVLVDLIAQPALANRGYSIAHFESPDQRSIDVALLYKASVFKPFETEAIPVELPKAEDKTRDILRVKGTINGDTLVVLVNHWPSKRGGSDESDPKRERAAQTARETVDRELIKNPNARIILIGDFNDTPDSKAITGTLNASKEIPAANRQLFNAFGSFPDQKKGSYFYKNDWEMIDQMMLSKGFLTNKGLHYIPNSATIFESEMIKEQEGKYKGSPLRTYAGKKYLGGYSDHLPIYLKVETR